MGAYKKEEKKKNNLRGTGLTKRGAGARVLVRTTLHPSAGLDPAQKRD